MLNNEMDDFSAKPNSPNGFGLIEIQKNWDRESAAPEDVPPTKVERIGTPHPVEFILSAVRPIFSTQILRTFHVEENFFGYWNGRDLAHSNSQKILPPGL